MSVGAYFAEVEAVVQVLTEFVQAFGEDEITDGEEIFSDDETFAAIWQAAELLSRAYQVLLPLMQLEMGKQALVLPDSYEKPSGLIVPDRLKPDAE